MRALNIAMIGLFGILFSFAATAQTASVSMQKQPKQKIFVSLQVTPSSPEFRAGLTAVDHLSNKLKLWICNGEQKKCTITIRNNEGTLWTNQIEDAYYSQVLDFSLVEDGPYTIRVSNGKESFEKKIVIVTNSYVQRTCAIQEQ